MPIGNIFSSGPLNMLFRWSTNCYKKVYLCYLHFRIHLLYFSDCLTGWLIMIISYYFSYILRMLIFMHEGAKSLGHSNPHNLRSSHRMILPYATFTVLMLMLNITVLISYPWTTQTFLYKHITPINKSEDFIAFFYAFWMSLSDFSLNYIHNCITSVLGLYNYIQCI